MANAGDSDVNQVQNNQWNWKEIAVLWSIKGYHIFKVRPHQHIPLLVLPDTGNQYDKDAMKVVMPDHVPKDMLELMTREGDKNCSPQKVKHILGKQVGRVPANLCRVFWGLLEKDAVLDSRIMCHYGGSAGHSVNPHVHKAFKKARTRWGRDIAGGGAELTCSYLILIKEDSYEDAVKLFKERLSEAEMEKALL